MNKRLLPWVLALFLTFPAAALVRADDKPPAPKEEDTELGKTMDKLNSAWRKLRKQAADPASNASSLEYVATIKAATEKSLTLKPAKADDLPADQREKFVADYQAKMKDFVAELGKLEAALKANDNAAAAAEIQKMGALQKEGHKAFKKPEK